MSDLQPSDEVRSLARTLQPFDESAALATATRLRATHTQDVVAAAMTQARLATRATSRFGSLADRLWWTADGLEQASRPEVAARHAARLKERGVGSVADLCCSLGLDSLAFAKAGMHVTGVDIDSSAITLATANAAEFGLNIDFHVGDALDPRWLAGADAAFIDPARRTTRGRTMDPETWSPPWSAVRALPAPLVLAKVAPGIAHGLLPECHETEWTSIGGSVIEASVLFGDAVSGQIRRAVLLDADAYLDSRQPGKSDVEAVGEYLYEPAAAAIQPAGLVQQVAALVAGSFIDEHIAYLTGPTLVRTPWASAFRVRGEIPFGLKPMRAFLKGMGYGNVVVKKRGIAVDPEELRKRLRLDGGGPTATLVLTRTNRPLALLVEPV